MCRKLLFSLMVFVLVLSLGGNALALVTETKDSADFSETWEGDTDPPTDYTLDGSGSTHSTSGGIFTYYSDGTGWPYYPSDNWASNVSDANGWSFEVKLKLGLDNSTGTMWQFRIDDDSSDGEIYIFSASEIRTYGGKVLSTASMTDDYHVFRVLQAASSQTFEVYLDGVLLGQDSPSLSSSAQLWWGSGSQSVDGTVYIDHIRIDYGGGYAPATDKAWMPTPVSGTTEMAVDVNLSWFAGDNAADVNGHDVYFGTNFDDVNDATTSVDPNNVYMGLQSGLTYDLSSLDMTTTHYWRIDEVNGASTWKGNIWSFTTVFDDYLAWHFVTASDSNDSGGTYPSSLTKDQSGLDDTLLLHSTDANDMWLALSAGSGSADVGTESGPAWIMFEFDRVCDLGEMYVWNGNDGSTNKNRGMRNVSVEYSSDGSTWTKLGAYEFSQASGSADDAGFTACDFNGAEVQYVVITANSTNGNWGGGSYYSLSEVRFFGSESSRAKDVLYGTAWTMQYDATNKKPSESGSLIFSDGTTGSGTGSYTGNSSVDSDYLTIDTMGTDGTCYYNIATNAGNMDLNSTDGYTIEWRVKLLEVDETTNGNVIMYCSPEANAWWTLQLVQHDGKNWATHYVGSSEEIEVDSDANNPDWHTYRINIYDGNASLYIDGNSNPDTVVALQNQVALPLRFGDLTGTADANYVTDYIYAYDGGAIGPKEFRAPAKDRTRRIIYDNDGADMVYYIDEATVDNFLDCRSTALLGTQVDTLVYCTWSSGFGQFTHNTSIGDIFTTTDSIFSNNKTQAFLDMGTDSLEMIVDFARDNDIEVFWSMRMNDIHDGWHGAEWDYFFNPLKEDNPDWLVGEVNGWSDANVVNGRWTSVNYAVSEVRSYAFQFIEEVCQNYDVDGVMLDFFRHPVFFKSHAEGNDCNDAERQMMTDLMTDVRKMANFEGMKRGKPILVAVRTPDSNTYCENIGLDIENWMANDLIDIWVPTGYFRMNTPEYSVDLGHQYDIPVYPSLDESRVSDTEGYVARATNEAYYSRAQNWLHSDANGIYSFNYFVQYSDMPRLDYMGQQSTLADLDKIYTTSTRGYDGSYTTWNNSDAKDYFNYDFVVPGEETLTITDSAVESLDILIGEDCPSTDPNVTLRLRFASALANTGDLTVDFNGVTVTGTPSGKMSLDSTTGYTVEWKVMLEDADATSGSYAMLYASPQANTWWALQLLQHDGKVWTTFYDGGSEVELDSDADNPAYHTLRVTVYGGNATLYIDGNSTAALTDALNTQVVLPLRFGDLTGAADANYYTDYLYASDEGAVAAGSDPNWTMRYEANYLPSSSSAITYLDSSTGPWSASGESESSVSDGKLYISTIDTDRACYFGISNDSWYDYIVTADDVNHGWNTVDMNLATGKSSVTLEDLVIEIDH